VRPAPQRAGRASPRGPATNVFPTTRRSSGSAKTAATRIPAPRQTAPPREREIAGKGIWAAPKGKTDRPAERWPEPEETPNSRRLEPTRPLTKTNPVSQLHSSKAERSTKGAPDVPTNGSVATPRERRASRFVAAGRDRCRAGRFQFR